MLLSSCCCWCFICFLLLTIDYKLRKYFFLISLATSIRSPWKRIARARRVSFLTPIARDKSCQTPSKFHPWKTQLVWSFLKNVCFILERLRSCLQNCLILHWISKIVTRLDVYFDFWVIWIFCRSENFYQTCYSVHSFWCSCINAHMISSLWFKELVKCFFRLCRYLSYRTILIQDLGLFY